MSRVPEIERSNEAFNYLFIRRIIYDVTMGKFKAAGCRTESMEVWDRAVGYGITSYFVVRFIRGTITFTDKSMGSDYISTAKNMG